uniref:Uncharacterized protein n=1 Tax=Rhizophora mucronata TaxID=61149 RepID=A0A2P2LJ77_RHIMU
MSILNSCIHCLLASIYVKNHQCPIINKRLPIWKPFCVGSYV